MEKELVASGEEEWRDFISGLLGRGDAAKRSFAALFPALESHRFKLEISDPSVWVIEVSACGELRRHKSLGAEGARSSEKGRHHE